MKKFIMMLTLTISINSVPFLGHSIIDNNSEIKDTFRIYVTSPIKI